MKWDNRPSISKYHPFKEEYERLLGLNEDELLMEIKNHVDDYFRVKSKRNQQIKINLDELIKEQWHKNSIETFYWKFINKSTKVKEE
jgi:hypothetical protein